MHKATAKQVAYLNYLGVRNAERLSVSEASDRIERLHQRAKHPCFKRLQSKIDDWYFDRLHLWPNLYTPEVIQYLLTLEDEFRGYVRRRVVGASERLTREKMSAVFSQLMAVDPIWWDWRRRDDPQAIFFAQLSLSFPGCVDGSSPEHREPRHEEEVLQPQKKGCVGLFGFLAIFATIVSAKCLTGV